MSKRKQPNKSRRRFLAGVGGVMVGLPFLEGLAPRGAKAGEEGVDPFAIFLRQANGVACEQDGPLGGEPERFWPHEVGALTPDNVAGRSLEVLSAHLSRLLVVGGINQRDYSYGDGHARGAMQLLTARGPVVDNAGGDSEADGESIDHRIGRELNPDGRDSLVLYSGRNTGGWLGGPCISYRGSGNRRAAFHDPLLGYQSIMGLDDSQLGELIVARQSSVNDLVRDQMQTLMSSPKLSSNDVQRLQLHFESIRELENTLTCNLAEDELAALEGLSAMYESDDGDNVLASVRAHMHVATVAVACGYTRSVSIQVGNGNDGDTKYRNLDDNSLMENFHYVSHRLLSHGGEGDVIPNADLLHSMVDRQFGETFAYLCDLLAAYQLPNGQSLIDSGMALWMNDNGNGPGHSSRNTPVVIAGSAGGFLKQGEYLVMPDSDGWGEESINHARLLNTIGSAAGLRDAQGDYISDFGDPVNNRTPLPELMA